MWRNSHSWPTAEPVVLGHEMAGVIESVADDVEGWQVGDRVVCETAASICGVCALCRAGRYNLCPYREGYGATRDGAFGQLLLAEPRVLHRIPDNVTFEEAAMTEPFAVAYNALVERAPVVPGDLVVIQGIGAIGALALQLAQLRGAGTTVVLGTAVDSLRLQKALELGADHAVDIGSVDVGALVNSLGDGLGADLVVDATGVSIALKQGLELVRPFGSIVKVGWGPQPLGFNLDPLVAKAVTLYGSFSHTWKTWERVLQLFSVGKLQPRSVLGGVYELGDWREAFEAMEAGRNIKSVVSMPA
jgi:alcohol dehydrogenase/L-iditol 2-dehydrogenase